MGTTWLIAVKDLRQRARDRSLFILAFVAPLALAFVFSTVFGGLDDTSDRIRFSYGLVDEDGGALADGFAGALDDLVASGLVELERPPDVSRARELVDDDTLSAVFVLPPGLSDSFATGTPSEIQVIGSIDAPISTSVAESIAQSFVTRSSTAALAGATAAATGAIEPDMIQVVADEVATAAPAVRLDTVETDAARLGLTTTMVAGMSVFFMFFVAGTAITGVLEERQAGTLPRLLVSPASRSSILFGKALAAVLVGVVALAALMVASTLVMGAEWGNPVGALLLSTCAVLAATGIMSAVGGPARTAEQAGNLQAIVAVSMAMLGGSFGLVAPASDTLWGRLALLTPNRWFLDGLDELRRGGVADALPAAGVLLSMGVVAGLIAARFAGRALRL